MKTLTLKMSRKLANKLVIIQSYDKFLDSNYNNDNISDMIELRDKIFSP